MSQNCKASLISIADALQTANGHIREEIVRNQKYSQKWNTLYAQEDSFFEQSALETLAAADIPSVPTPDDDLTDLMSKLADTSYYQIWRVAVHSLTGFLDSKWMMAKEKALDFLEARDITAELFDGIENELATQGFYEVYNGIMKKIRILERFKGIYDAQPANRTEPLYSLYVLRNKKRKQVVAEAYPEMQQVVCGPFQHRIYSIRLLTAHIGISFHINRRSLNRYPSCHYTDGFCVETIIQHEQVNG